LTPPLQKKIHSNVINGRSLAFVARVEEANLIVGAATFGFGLK